MTKVGWMSLLHVNHYHCWLLLACQIDRSLSWHDGMTVTAVHPPRCVHDKHDGVMSSVMCGQQRNVCVCVCVCVKCEFIMNAGCRMSHRADYSPTTGLHRSPLSTTPSPTSRSRLHQHHSLLYTDPLLTSSFRQPWMDSSGYVTNSLGYRTVLVWNRITRFFATSPYFAKKYEGVLIWLVIMIK